MDLFAVLFSRQGRIGRANYWLGIGVTVPLVLVLTYIDRNYSEAGDLVPLLIGAAVGILNLWINICVAAKRYHDRGKSGWWILIALIPIAGGIWQIIELGMLRGDEGPNEYGPDPLQVSIASGGAGMTRQQGGSPSSAGAAASPVAAVTMARPRSPYIDGRPVFGKRV